MLETIREIRLECREQERRAEEVKLLLRTETNAWKREALRQSLRMARLLHKMLKTVEKAKRLYGQNYERAA